ncbi:extracellular solute-binding protein [Janibacter sp. G56]|uniref:extracellular solute-binding protein n=1 Tax=Janibacter sp. G56 TaxID=3418717 RepID=UPI003D015A47
MRNTSRALAIALAGGLALSACGGGSDSTSSDTASDASTTAPADLKAELTWWDTSDATNEGPTYKKLIKAFNEEYPNVKVTYQSVPFGDAQNKFKTAAAAKSGAPDILRAEVAWVPEFASLGYLYELDGTVLTEDQSDFLPAAVSSTKFEDKTYGVPQVTDSLGLFYNKKLLKEAGVNAPTTWDEMKEAAATIKSKTGKDGVYLNPAGYYLLPFIYGEGGDLLDSGAKKITVNSAEAVAGVEKAQELLTSPGFTKAPATDAYTEMMGDFNDGKVAMMIQGPWEIANVKNAKKFGGLDNLGIAPVPAGSQKAGAPVGGHDYVVWSGMPQEKADAAIAFIQFMTSAETQATVADELGVLPTRTSAYDKVTNPVIAEFKPVMESAVERAWIPEGGKLFGPMDEAAIKLMVQGADAQKTLDAVAKKYKSEVVTDYATE